MTLILENLAGFDKSFRVGNKYADKGKWMEEKEKIIPLLKKENIKINKLYYYPLFLLDDIKFLVKKLLNINFFYHLK